jgi:hypothetical protein
MCAVLRTQETVVLSARRQWDDALRALLLRCVNVLTSLAESPTGPRETDDVRRSSSPCRELGSA